MVQSLWQRIRAIALEIWLFLTSWVFWRNLLGILAVFFLFGFLTLRWLNCYTDHGESLQVHDYVGMDVAKAQEMAASRSFQLVITDSVFLVNKRPFTVIEQHPKPLSRVKEDRKIYVTTTKKRPEKVQLPDLRAGNDDFQRYQRKLAAMNVGLTVRGKEYNKVYAEGTILKVYYKGEQITKKIYSRQGFKVYQTDTLEAVISTRSSGRIEVPEVVCLSLEEARFILDSHNLELGVVHEDATVTDPESAFVFRQVPSFSAQSTIAVGGSVEVYLTQDRPQGCE